MTQIVLIRQRPSIGDCLLLAPLIQAVRERHPDPCVTVVTDSSYMSGALTTVFEHIPGVDKVQDLSPFEWTTQGNKLIDRKYMPVPDTPPLFISKADVVLDANSAFMEYERKHKGNPPLGIAEFWLQHFNLKSNTIGPSYETTDNEKKAAKNWEEAVNPSQKSMVGIVLRSGSPCRDWDYSKAPMLARNLYTMGLKPISIDPILITETDQTVNLVGRKISFVAAAIERMRLLITPDTGLLHLAEALNVPTVALWGIMRPELRVKGYSTVVVPERSLGQCTDRYCPSCTWPFQRWSCTRSITPAMIASGVRRVLSG